MKRQYRRAPELIGPQRLALLASAAIITCSIAIQPPGPAAAQQATVPRHVLENIELVGKVILQTKPGRDVSFEQCWEKCLTILGCSGLSQRSDGSCAIFSAQGLRQTVSVTARSIILEHPIGTSRGTAGGSDTVGDDGTFFASRTRPAGERAKASLPEPQKLCGPGYRAHPSTNFSGFDINSQGNRVTAVTCRHLCNSRKNCRGFTWITLEKLDTAARCWLKSALDGIGPKKGHVSCERL